jgi:hypothetical protein
MKVNQANKLTNHESMHIVKLAWETIQIEENIWVGEKRTCEKMLRILNPMHFAFMCFKTNHILFTHGTSFGPPNPNLTS